MNIQTAAEEIGISVDAYKRLCTLFIKNTDKDLSQLHTAIENKSMKTAADTAHHIKGAASNMDFSLLAKLAKDLQLRILSGTESQDSLMKYYDNCFNEYKRIKLEIEGQL